MREAYHGEPYATKVLVPEAFQELRVPIYAATLQDRLPATLVVAEQRERKIYGETDQAEIERVLQSYRDFVALCARKEAETGEPCLIIASCQSALDRDLPLNFHPAAIRASALDTPFGAFRFTSAYATSTFIFRPLLSCDPGAIDA